jgi:cyclohexa-1,5-dienecarbonyl-CoA hydratase
MSDQAIRIEEILDGACWRVVLNRPKANILDSAMVEELIGVLERTDPEVNPAARNLRALIFEGEGKHFSFGASVEEHKPGEVEKMLPTFHRLFEKLLESRLFLIAALRGQCLGGGLELAAFCHRVIASPDTKLGQPEIQLGVIAPVASLVLPERCGRAHAADLCLTGRIVDAAEAKAMGLVDEICDDPGSTAVGLVEERLCKLSASSLRHAVAALNLGFQETFHRNIGRAETLYLDELMATADAVEGISSFLDKRSPQWSQG